MTIFNIAVGLSNIGSFLIAIWLARPLWEHRMSDWRPWLAAAVLLCTFALNSYMLLFRGDRSHARTEVSGDQHTSAVKVVGRTFINERVVLDNAEYVNCTFENVTFVYSGSPIVRLINNNIQGSRMIASENQEILRMLKVMHKLEMLKAGTRVFE